MPLVAYISDLPPQVKSILSVDLQNVFLQHFNAVFSMTNSETDAYQSAWVKVFQVAFPGEVVMPDQLPQMAPPTVATPAPSAGALAAAGLSESKGFWVDVSSFKLEEDDTSWIQAFPVGTWHHPKHGKIEMTQERAARFAANVNNNVRGQELDIDYDHKERTNEASGWVKAARAASDGLWLKVQWTADAASKIKQKAYRYFSPEYLDEWEEPRSKMRIKDVLLGGALTNRPFLKGILPVNLSEVLSNTKAHNDGGKMDWNEIRAMLGLPDGTPEDTVKAEFTKRLAPVTEPVTVPPATPVAAVTPPAPVGDPVTPQLVTANDGGLTPEVRALAESDPLVRSLTERIDRLDAANKLSEISIKLSSLDSENVALAPASRDKLRDLMLDAPRALSDKLFDFAKEIVASGVVSLSEIGHTQPLESNAGPAKRFSDAVDAKVKADTTLSYNDAVDIVATENPALFNEYRRASYLKEGV